jgi:hypothetical protein
VEAAGGFDEFSILEHLRVLETELADASDEVLLAFAAACCERQVVEFERAARGIDLVCRHQLFLSEVNRQLDDIRMLREETSIQRIQLLRERSTGAGLFGGLWYP